MEKTNDVEKRKYTTIYYKGKYHVLTDVLRERRTGAKKANFNGTGLALAGVLKEDETLSEWIKRVEKVKNKIRHG